MGAEGGAKGVALTMHPLAERPGRRQRSAAQGLSSGRCVLGRLGGKAANAPHVRSVLYGRDEHHVVKPLPPGCKN